MNCLETTMSLEEIATLFLFLANRFIILSRLTSAFIMIILRLFFRYLHSLLTSIGFARF